MILYTLLRDLSIQFRKIISRCFIRRVRRIFGDRNGIRQLLLRIFFRNIRKQYRKAVSYPVRGKTVRNRCDGISRLSRLIDHEHLTHVPQKECRDAQQQRDICQENHPYI